MKLPQVFTGGLRAEFADAACALVPEYLATLTRRLDGDNEHSSEECEYGASPTEKSSGVDRRGRCRATRAHGSAAEWPTVVETAGLAALKFSLQDRRIPPIRCEDVPGQDRRFRAAIES
jgi:hypothetical protein